MIDFSGASELASVYAFLGNSLLDTMRHTGKVGLDIQFWDAFPVTDDPEVTRVIDKCRAFAEGAAKNGATDWVTEISVEYTQLFVGPPRPQAAPWETFYVAEGVHTGFGQATFDMRDALREAGLQVQNDNNQYEDHMGIELLFLSTLLSTAAQATTKGEYEEAFARAQSFAKRPASWVHDFANAVKAAAPDGYYHNLVALTEAMLAYLLQN